MATRFIIFGVVTLGMLLPAAWAAGHADPGSALASAQPEAPLFAAPAVEPPSEPWDSPAGPAARMPGAIAPDSELPMAGANDPAAAAAAEDPAMRAILEESQKSWYSPQVWFGPSPWDSGVELGVNGSSGTSDSFSVHSGAFVKRESRFSKIDFDTDYNFTKGNGKASQNNASVDLTNDWLIDEKSPWTLFAKTNLFYDKFATFDLQTNANLGVGYRFVHSSELDLMGRVGAGAEREFGGDQNDWVPESLVGFEYSQRVTKTQKFCAKIEYFPEWHKAGEFRSVGDVGWEIELVQPSNLSLKLSASDRYDSTPEGVSPHLMNYSVLLLLKL